MKVNHKNYMFWNDYAYWIMSKIGINPKKYSKLCIRLHEISFRWDNIRFEKDRNRAYDGEDLREKYYKICSKNEHYIINFDERPCSCLEMLAALAIRIDGDYVGDYENPDPGMIFLDMLDNLGLGRYDNSYYIEMEIDDLVDKWLDREYDYDGNGSIFPVKHANQDHRNVEIWLQMTEYVSRNY